MHLRPPSALQRVAALGAVVAMLAACATDTSMHRTLQEMQDYDAYIASREAFLAKYPQSAYATKVRDEIIRGAAASGDFATFRRWFERLPEPERKDALRSGLWRAVEGWQFNMRPDKTLRQSELTRAAFIRELGKMGLDVRDACKPYRSGGQNLFENPKLYEEQPILLGILVKMGAEPNYWLSRAIEDNSIGLVEVLLEHGAQANGVGRGGEPLLIGASRRNQAKMVSLLLAHGADANIRWKDQTPLKAVVGLCGQYEGLRPLEILQGASPKPLEPSPALVKALLDAGAKAADVAIPKPAELQRSMEIITGDGKSRVNVSTPVKTTPACEDVARLLQNARLRQR